MSIIGSFDRTKHFVELADNATDQHGNLLTPTERRNTAVQNISGNSSLLASELAALQGLTATSTELNKLDGATVSTAEINILTGVTSDASEINLLDGSVEANTAASVAPVLDTGKALRTNANVGTSAATSVVEYGDGFNHVTVLTITGLTFSDEPDNETVAFGDLVYTLPAGAVILDSAYFNIALTQGGDVKTDNYDIGLGTVIGTGVVSVLGGTPTFEDIITGQTETGTQDGTNFTVVASVPTVGAPLFIASADAHTVHVNVAAVWSDIDVPALTYDGVVILNWKFLE